MQSANQQSANQWTKHAARAALIGGGAAAAGLLAAGGAAAAGYALWRRRGRFALAGRAVLITGGSRGLGFALAREFLRHGARVAIAARDPEELRCAAALLAAFRGPEAIATFVSDLALPDAPARLVADLRSQWGAVDVLVHNAGLMQIGPYEAMAEEDYRQAMELHFYAALRLARAVLPEMIERRCGRIVNIASIGGLVAVPHMLPYTASKFALVGFSQGLGSEVRRHGVRVTCVCPFLTRTGSQERVVVKGRHQREFSWFAAAGSLPLLTQSAPAAARRIVAACRAGDAQLTLTVPGKLAALAHGVAPGAVVATMAAAARLLPAAAARADSAADAPRTGRDCYTPATQRLVRPAVRPAGRPLNQS